MTRDLEHFGMFEDIFQDKFYEMKLLGEPVTVVGVYDGVIVQNTSLKL